MKVVFNLSDQQITIEGDGEQIVDVLKAVREVAPSITHIQLETTSSARPESAESTRNGQQADQIGASTGIRTLKQFVRAIRLSNTAERIAAIAYHIRHQENRESFSPKEMGAWFTMCGLAKPNQMPVALFGAKNRYGYVDSAGHGRFKLTTNGENLVVGKLNAAEEAADGS
jgi:hypothetical protein